MFGNLDYTNNSTNNFLTIIIIVIRAAYEKCIIFLKFWVLVIKKFIIHYILYQYLI